MDRRRFLGLLGGGLVASATMAQADKLADFLNWLKKGPTAYSFPTDIQIAKKFWIATYNHRVYESGLWKSLSPPLDTFVYGVGDKVIGTIGIGEQV